MRIRTPLMPQGPSKYPGYTSLESKQGKLPAPDGRAADGVFAIARLERKHEVSQDMTVKTLRFVPLGGLGEVGENMMSLEYGDNVLVGDTGIMFPENDMLGSDY